MENCDHPENIMICCVSEWHFETICQICLINHCEIHTKNKTVPNIKKITEIRQNCQDNLNKGLQNIQQLQKQIENIHFDVENDQILVKIRQYKQTLISQINSIFDVFEKNHINGNNILQQKIQINIGMKKYHKLMILILIQNFYKMKLIYKNCKQVNNLDIQCYIRFIYIKTIFNQKLNMKICFLYHRLQLQIEQNNNKTMKSVYFKDYDLISQNKKIQTIIDFNVEPQDIFINQKKFKFIQENIQNLLTHKITENIQDYENLNVKKVQEPPTKKKFLEKKHICLKCGSQMEYISDFKKHLVCQQCSNTKRNYVK